MKRSVSGSEISSRTSSTSAAARGRSSHPGIVAARRGQHGLAPLGHEPGAGAAVGEVLGRERELVLDRPAQLGLADRHAGRERLAWSRSAATAARLGAEAAREPRRGVPAGAPGAPTSGSRCGAARAVGDAVDGVLRHRAVGRELAADDGQRARRRVLDDRVAAREVGGRRAPSPASSGPQPGVAAGDVLRAERDLERGARVREQLRLLLGARRRLVGDRPVGGDVGEPDRDQPVGARQREHPAPALARHGHVDRRARVAEPPGRDEQVRAAARPQRDRRARARRPTRRWRGPRGGRGRENAAPVSAVERVDAVVARRRSRPRR